MNPSERDSDPSVDGNGICPKSQMDVDQSLREARSRTHVTVFMLRQMKKAHFGKDPSSSPDALFDLHRRLISGDVCVSDEICRIILAKVTRRIRVPYTRTDYGMVADAVAVARQPIRLVD